ncbi:hypothetical protein FOXG_00427 [Fusarium oxysporum f. sp. lycopersici 4287]|uniref:Uncharacterized protein n=2 Tax=Fusarium oxysporum TaxID=5507 RepID=A0A0J9U682_FUSO4|nr:hypothetical protein FOXG_00427 [Fusarium oxysporum f. sp. lycopersici 4287]EXK47938.1 hypothetical protein FOMG_01124 [Fusarium oxysporum f. sp. melonis 26406]KNA94327.1 hypothetical protein FOXG_00427 [Fusarium oxysporum f. sp. lycopersici 4287]
MLSFKHHALYWVLSLLTVPLTSIRKLLFGHELFMGSIDEIEFATMCLSMYFVVRPVLDGLQDFHREVEVGVAKCSGLIKVAALEKPVEENSITKEVESRNGNAKGTKPNKGRKKPAKSANDKPRAVHFQKESSQNGNAKLSNGNRALQNIAAAQRLRKKSTGRYTTTQQSFFNLAWKYLDVLYYMSLGILFTHTEPLFGFGECVGNDHLQSVGRVLVSFLVIGTLEPIRQNVSSCYVVQPRLFANELFLALGRRSVWPGDVLLLLCIMQRRAWALDLDIDGNLWLVGHGNPCGVFLLYKAAVLALVAWCLVR